MPPTPRARQTPNLTVDLGNLSSPERRLVALIDGLGFTPDEIAQAMDVTAPAVYRWMKGERLTPRNEKCLDEFRTIAFVLFEELGRDAVRAFFISRPALGKKRPLEYIRTDPDAVGAAAMAEILRQHTLDASEDAERREEVRGTDENGNGLLEGDAAEIIAAARDDTVDPAKLPTGPEVPESVDDAHIDQALERLDWGSNAAGNRLA